MTKERKISGEAIVGKLSDIVKEMLEKGFYGEILMKFEAGNIVVLKKTESIKFS